MKSGIKYKEDGITYEIEITAINAIYPYEYRKVWVHAVPVSRNNKKYQETKRILGDDWLSDITECWIDKLDLDNEEEYLKFSNLLDEARASKEVW